MAEKELSQRSLTILFFVFKTLPTLVAGMSIYLGYRLFLLGVTGKASLAINSGSLSGQLINAAPGIFFAVGGLVALIIVVWRGVHIHVSEAPNKSKIRVMKATPED